MFCLEQYDFLPVLKTEQLLMVPLLYALSGSTAPPSHLQSVLRINDWSGGRTECSYWLSC